jgi:hypothetical protein
MNNDRLSSLDLAKDARVRFEGKESKLSDLQPGMPIRMKLKTDRKTVGGIAAISVPAKQENDD